MDVGANIGYFTILMAEAVGEEGAVLAFEPDAENLRLLRAVVARTGLSNIQPFLMTRKGELYASSWSDIEGVVQDRYIDVLLSRQSVEALN